MSVGSPTAIWLSGGWDSTAVLASGAAGLAARGDPESLHAVSISFPPGDPGREDELITDAAGYWQSPIHWLSIADIPLLEDPATSAASRDDVYAHPFERGNRALADGAREAGARVALDGVGGDQCFQVSDVYLADLLATGRWLSLAREWQCKGTSGSGFRSFFRLAIQPVLPPPLLGLAAAMRRGQPLRGYLERPLPAWMEPDFVRRAGLLEREQRNTPVRRGWSAATYESRWYLLHPYFSRAFASVSELALERGVELRSPLMDRRIVEFAMSRPRGERASGTETKRLLRAAMRGMLPDHVLAPRPHRTGITSRYFLRSLKRTHAPFISTVLDAPLELAHLGMVDPTRLRQAWHGFQRGGGVDLASSLLATVHAELWLRSRQCAGLPSAETEVRGSAEPALMAS